MKLTDKCKEDFYKWLYEEHRLHLKDILDMDFEEEILLNALTIEFFDSSGIYIFPVQFESKIYCNLRNTYGALISQTDRLQTRQEATNQAILTANKLYNEANKN